MVCSLTIWAWAASFAHQHFDTGSSLRMVSCCSVLSKDHAHRNEQTAFHRLDVLLPQIIMAIVVDQGFCKNPASLPVRVKMLRLFSLIMSNRLFGSALSQNSSLRPRDTAGENRYLSAKQPSRMFDSNMKTVTAPPRIRSNGLYQVPKHRAGHHIANIHRYTPIRVITDRSSVPRKSGSIQRYSL
jgi:hypothetical protein